MTRTLAILASKGGVGKTTVAVNLAVALAEAGQRVTLIDLDPSANLTLLCGVGPADIRASTVDLLRGQTTIDEAALQVVPQLGPRESRKHREQAELWRKRQLWLVPAEPQLQDVGNALSQQPRGEEALARALQVEADAGRDLGTVIVDCKHGYEPLSLTAAIGAGRVLAPVIPHQQNSIEGLAQTINTAAGLRDELGLDVRIFGILRTHVDRRDRSYKDNIAQLRELPELLKVEIPRTIDFDTAQNQQQPFMFVRPDALPSQQYRDLAKELDDRFKKES